MIKFFSRYLNQLILLPSIILILACGFYLTKNMLLLGNTSDTKQLLYLTDVSMDLVHELQKERGLTAAYISSKGTSFTQKLKQQRPNTDSAISAFKQFIQQEDISALENKAQLSIKNIVSALNQIRQHRGRVDALDIPPPTH